MVEFHWNTGDTLYLNNTMCSFEEYIVLKQNLLVS